MKKIILLFGFYLSFTGVNGQTCPKGFTEQYGYNTVGGGNINDFKPSLVIRACIEDKPGSAGQQVFWNVKGLLHSYKTVKFTKHIKLTCGNTINKQVILYGLKNGESIGGGSFSGDIDLSDNIFKEDCANANRIARVWADNFTCELADDDPLMVQEKNRQTKLKETVQTGTNSSTSSSTPVTRTSSPRSSPGTSPSATDRSNSSTSSTGKSSGGYSGNYGTVKPDPNAAIYNKLNQDMQRNTDNYQAVVGGLQQLGGLLQANRERKQAEENAARERREQRAEEEKAEKAERDQKEAERRAAFEEDNRIRAAAAKREMDRQWGIDVQIMGNYLVRKKTSEIPDNVKQVYYIVYQRKYQTNQVTIKTYSLNRYSDDTWMLEADLLNKLQFTPYFNSDGVGQLLGFYGNKEQALAAMAKIKSSVASINVDNSFLLLNSAAPAKADKDFWNN